MILTQRSRWNRSGSSESQQPRRSHGVERAAPNPPSPHKMRQRRGCKEWGSEGRARRTTCRAYALAAIGGPAHEGRCASVANAVSVEQSDPDSYRCSSCNCNCCRPSRRPRIARNGEETIRRRRPGKLKIPSEFRPREVHCRPVRCKNTMREAARACDCGIGARGRRTIFGA